MSVMLENVYPHTPGNATALELIKQGLGKTLTAAVQSWSINESKSYDRTTRPDNDSCLATLIGYSHI